MRQPEYGFSRTTPDFNPRIPRETRHSDLLRITDPHDFNPRTPRGMRLQKSFGSCLTGEFQSSFQSSRPTRDATNDRCNLVKIGNAISILASHTECDGAGVAVAGFKLYFNPRIPRGMRQQNHTNLSPKCFNRFVRFAQFSVRSHAYVSPPPSISSKNQVRTSWLSMFAPASHRPIRTTMQVNPLTTCTCRRRHHWTAAGPSWNRNSSRGPATGCTFPYASPSRSAGSAARAPGSAAQ